MVKFATKLADLGVLYWECNFEETFSKNVIPQSFEKYEIKQFAEIRFPGDSSNPLGLQLFKQR